MQLMDRPVERLYTPEQAAEILNTNERKVKNLLRSGEIVGTKVGREWRIHPGDLQDFINRNKTNK